MATSKTKGTNAKIKELKSERPEKVSDAQLSRIKNIVDRILEDGVRAKKSKRGLADPNYVKKTLTDARGEDFAKQIMKDADIPPKVLRELLGEVQDPRYGIFNAITDLSGISRMSAMFKEMLSHLRNPDNGWILED